MSTLLLSIGAIIVVVVLVLFQRAGYWHKITFATTNLEGGTFASLLHVGPYQNIGGVYKKLGGILKKVNVIILH
jgi:effector-binding domain-containing protein